MFIGSAYKNEKKCFQESTEYANDNGSYNLKSKFPLPHATEKVDNHQ